MLIDGYDKHRWSRWVGDHRGGRKSSKGGAYFSMPVLLAATSAVSKLMLVQGYVGHWLVLPQQQPFALRRSLPAESRITVKSRACHGREWIQLASRCVVSRPSR